MTSATVPGGNNKAGGNVASGATFDIWDGAATVDELYGSGTINKGNAFGTGANTTPTIGAMNGSGTFNGLTTNMAGATNLVKQGTGTQILTGSSAPETFVVSGTDPLTVVGTVASSQAAGGKLFGRLRANL